MKCLYATISSKEAAFRLHRAADIQKRFNEALQGWDKVLVTDSVNPADPPEGYSILKVPLFKGDKLHFPTYRNVTMQYASENGYDWLIQSTADLVILHGPSSFPPNSFTSVMTYLASPGEDIGHVIARWKAGSPMAFGGSTYFLMGRGIFTKYRFHGGYLGYGYEDADFMSNILWPEGIERLDGTPFGARAIHIHEPANQWVRIGEDLQANQALFESRLAKARSGERL
jgi:hypothetical protein